MSVFPSRLKSANATPRPCCIGSSTPVTTNTNISLHICCERQTNSPFKIKVSSKKKGASSYLPTCAATSVNVPSPLLRNRKLGLYSLSQKISGRVWLRMGPTTTPRPPVTHSRDAIITKHTAEIVSGFPAHFPSSGSLLLLLTQTLSAHNHITGSVNMCI